MNMERDIGSYTFMIFGAGGILGKAILARLSSPSAEYRIFAFDHAKADISDPSHVVPLMEYIKPTVVINCASVSDPDMCEEARDGAIMVNCTGPAILAKAAKDFKAKFIHFSSAHVFDGQKRSPYSEKNRTVPVNHYGLSKLAGEKMVRKTNPDSIIIRPGLVFGMENPSNIENWISMAEQKKEIGVLDNYISPIYAPDLAEATIELVLKGVTGVYHIANSGYATQEIFVKTVLGLSGISDPPVVRADKNLHSMFKATVPHNATLLTSKYEQVMKHPLRHWEDALKHCLFAMRRYSPK